MKGEREKKMKLPLVNKGFEKEESFLSKTTTLSSRLHYIRTHFFVYVSALTGCGEMTEISS